MPDFFEIDLALTTWRPEGIKALAEEVSRSFETEVLPDEVEFSGAEGASSLWSSMQAALLADDESVKGFCSESDGASKDSTSSRVLRVEVPGRVLSALRQPRKVALLASGKQLLKYCGEVKGFNVDFALKLFDCGHFHIKETVGGSSAGPRGAIFEGRWEKGAQGLRLEYLLRYPCQQNRRREASVAYEAVPHEVREASLSFKGSSKGAKEEDQLEGQLPTSCTEEATTGFVTLRREEEISEQQAKNSRLYDDDDDEGFRAMLRPQVKNPPRQMQRPKPYREYDEERDWDSDEPTWPMYLGIFLFIVIFCVFAWVWYEERYYPESDSKKEFDEL